jgi:hypothetical protein
MSVALANLRSWEDDPEAVHRWYRIIMGFDWKLADHILDLLGAEPGHLVIDPFSGAGTTLVQCKKRGIDAAALDVNPVCALATRVKTTWNLNPSTATRLLDRIVAQVNTRSAHADALESTALAYLQASGMIERGWVSYHKAKIVLQVKSAIDTVRMSPQFREFFYLALISALVNKIADITFGPEVYVVKPRRAPALPSFTGFAEQMIADLRATRSWDIGASGTSIILDDSRNRSSFRRGLKGKADFAVTSPPYPNEHDYTRSTRLELVVLGHISELGDLRALKRDMLRCTTKGIYKGDADEVFVGRNREVSCVSDELNRRAKRYSDGFSQLYGKMVREYFGGMARHFQAIAGGLKRGARCAYVVRDTYALLGVYIDTPTILARVAQSLGLGFRIDDLVEWKQVRGTTGKHALSEKIILLTKTT